MLPSLAAFAAMVPAILLLDLVWLGVLMKDFYRSQIGHLMSGGIVWPAAIIFYLVFAAGLAYFAVSPAKTLAHAALLGAVLGALCYATYDLTNQATLKDWPLVVTLADIAWGAALSAAVASIGFMVAKLV